MCYPKKFLFVGLFRYIELYKRLYRSDIKLIIKNWMVTKSYLQHILLAKTLKHTIDTIDKLENYKATQTNIRKTYRFTQPELHHIGL